jgi:uncharacterized protein YaiL (DUF2058 family)
MFDLKAQMLKKGLITKEQAESSKKTQKTDNFLLKERAKTLDSLKTKNKSEQYATIRKWVDLNRLDKPDLVSIDDEKFFFSTNDEQISWLTLKKPVVEEIKSGKAGVISYMSHHGLTHAVVEREIAQDVGELFPAWLKVLNDLA